MTTPADWYPDPEDPASLRYWDGAGWTEHRAPAAAPQAPAAEAPVAQADEFPANEQATSVVSLPDHPTADPPDGGAHRAADADADQEPSAPPSSTPTPGQPYDTHPPTSWDAPMPSWDEPPTTQTYAPPPTQSFEAAPFAPPPGPPGTPPPPPGPSGERPNTKLVIGILGGAAAILLALVVVIVLVVMRKDEPTVTTAKTTTSSTSETTSSETTSERSTESSATESPTPPPTGAEGSDGSYTFSVASTETGDTITSTVSDSVQSTANGMYYVVYLNVANTGPSPLTFVATFQQLSAAGQTFPLDDAATAFLGGTIADVAPGDQVKTPLVYDIPVGTTPDSIMVRADPASPGVQLPLE